MNKEVEDLTLARLRDLREEIAALRRERRDDRQLLFSIAEHAATMSKRLTNIESDVVDVRRQLGEQSDRLERIERRLKLAEPEGAPA